MLALCCVEDKGKFGYYLFKDIYKLKGNKIDKSYRFNKKIYIVNSKEMIIGAYGIFKIKSNSEDIAQATFRDELQIIAICKFENITNLQDLSSLLVNGIDEENELKKIKLGQKIFFTSENLLDESNNYLGFLCDVSDIDYSGSKFFLKKSINHLLKYSLLKSNIIMLKNDFYGDCAIYKEIYDSTKENTKKEFYSIEESNNDEKSKIDKKNIEVWQEEQLEFFDRKQDVFLKNQKEFGDIFISNNKDFMERILKDRVADLQKTIDSKIDKEELEKILKDQLDVIYREKDITENQLEEKFSLVQKNIENKINKEELNSLFSKLDKLENDFSLSLKEELKSFSKKISDLASKIKKQEKDNQGFFDLLSDLEGKINILESNIAQQDNVEKEAVENNGDIVLEENIGKQGDFVSHLIHSNNFYKDDSFTKQVINNCEDLFGKLDENLYSIGFTKSYDFGCFLYLLYKKNIPLFLLGPNGENIADTFSITMFGKLAVRLECLGDYSLSIKEEIARIQDKVVIIKNPFNWILICSLLS